GTQQIAERRRNVTRLALEPEPLQRAPEPIGELAIPIEVDLVAFCGLALHLLARDRDGGASVRELLLAFTEEIGAAEIVDDLSQHVAPAPRPWATTVGLDEVPFAVGHPAAQRLRSHGRAAAFSGRVEGRFHGRNHAPESGAATRGNHGGNCG